MVTLAHQKVHHWLMSHKRLTGLCCSVLQEAPVGGDQRALISRSLFLCLALSCAGQLGPVTPVLSAVPQ